MIEAAEKQRIQESPLVTVWFFERGDQSGECKRADFDSVEEAEEFMETFKDAIEVFKTWGM